MISKLFVLDLGPDVWRNAVYKEETAAACMYELFEKEVELFKGWYNEFKQKDGIENVAIIEVGLGTAELFAKVPNLQFDP